MGGKKRRRIAQEAKDTAAASLASAQGEQAKAMADVQSQKAAYENFQFENPYGNLSMENFAEDLTVNTQQADFQAQQGAQQRANIMQNLQGAAGGSGIAGLAQAMANQGQLQTQQISASIGAQESAQQAAKVKGAMDVQRRRELEASGAAAVQQAESGRMSTLLGMDYGTLAAANQGVQQGLANQQSAVALEAEMENANKQMIGGIVSGGIGAIGGILTGGLSAGGFLNK